MDITDLSIAQMERSYRNSLINSLNGYKCLQLIGTIGKDGHSNLGLFSSVIHLGSFPALFGVVFRPKSQNHDTLSNIERSKIYTMNNVSYAKPGIHTQQI